MIKITPVRNTIFPSRIKKDETLSQKKSNETTKLRELSNIPPNYFNPISFKGAKKETDLSKEISQLKNENAEVRLTSIIAITEKGAPEQFEKYVPPMLKDKDNFVRMTAIEAIRREGTPEQFEKYLPPMLKDKNDLVRWCAVNVMGEKGTPEQIEKYISPMLKDKSPYVRMAAQKAITKNQKNK